MYAQICSSWPSDLPQEKHEEFEGFLAVVGSMRALCGASDHARRDGAGESRSYLQNELLLPASELRAATGGKWGRTADPDLRSRKTEAVLRGRKTHRKVQGHLHLRQGPESISVGVSRRAEHPAALSETLTSPR